MLSKISWEQYWTFLGMVTLSYLLVIIIVYYRNDLILLAKKKRPAAASLHPTENRIEKAPSDVSSKSESHTQEPKLFAMVHDLMEELKGVFITASKSGSNKQELLIGLQIKLGYYLRLRDSEFEEGIIHHIILESNEHCGISLHAGDIEAIWE